MYDDLSVMLLKYLHQCTWAEYVDGGKQVLSSLDYREFYDLLLKALNIFEVILTKIIDDKYPSKFANIESNQAF